MPSTKQVDGIESSSTEPALEDRHRLLVVQFGMLELLKTLPDGGIDQDVYITELRAITGRMSAVMREKVLSNRARMPHARRNEV